MISKKLCGLALIFFSVSVVGCTSRTTIRTTDPGVKIYVDGEYKGQGTVDYSDKKIVGSTTSVRLEKEGCLPVTNSFSRSEEFNVGACIGGVFLLVPFLWVMDYKGERTYDFVCSQPR